VLTPSCLTLSRLVARSIAWSPGGRVILVVGARPGELDRPGVVRVRRIGDEPARAESWRASPLLWHMRFHGRAGSVFDVAYDPAAPRLAVVTSVAPGTDGRPEVALMALDAWPTLDDAEWVDGSACQVAWDPSGERLAIVQVGASAGCRGDGVPGRLVSVAAAAPRQPRTLAPGARNPAWHP
jgi:hypothetical protein